MKGIRASSSTLLTRGPALSPALGTDGGGGRHLSPAHVTMWQMKDGARCPMFPYSGLAHLCCHQQGHLCCVAQTKCRAHFPTCCSLTISDCSLILVSSDLPLSRRPDHSPSPTPSPYVLPSNPPSSIRHHTYLCSLE